MNSQKKKLIITFIIGVLIGTLLTAGCFTVYEGSKKNENPEISDKTDSSEEKDQTDEKEDADEEESEENENVNIADTWDKATAYNGGARVVYKGLEYEAKWWTQGEEPKVDGDGVWTLIGEAKVPSVDDEEDEPIVSDKKVAGVKDFKVVAYYPSWKPSETGKIQYDLITHINYAFAIPTADGGLRPLENPDVAKALIAQGHKNNTKVLLAVGGWSYNDTPLEPTFVSATDSPEKIKKFGDAIIKMCNDYGFDGIDMDWEHPRADGKSKQQYKDLMVYLSKELHKQDKLLTAAVLSGVTADGNVLYDAAGHLDAALNSVDWINVMAYDGGDGERHSSYDFAVNSEKYWRKTRKLPAHKVVLGVPFYGRPSWAAYDAFLQNDSDAYKKDVTTFNGMEAHYNGMPTITKKAKYAKAHCGGVMIWEITQDTKNRQKSLQEAIRQGIK